jgi:transposase
MAKPLVSDELWAAVEPLLPPMPGSALGVRLRVPDRAALTGILFVLKSGIPWLMLPKEMECGSGSTCWRRLRDWEGAGVWLALHHLLLVRLQVAEQIDWSRVCVDSSTVPAPKGAQPQECTHGGERGRLQASAATGGCDPAAVHPSGRAPSSAQVARRQGLRECRPTARFGRAANPPAHRTAGRREQ